MTYKEFQVLTKFTTVYYNNKECRVMTPSLGNGKVQVWVFHHCQKEDIHYGRLKVKYNEFDLPASDCSLSKRMFYIEMDGLILTRRLVKNHKTGDMELRFGTTEKKFIPGCTGEGYLYDDWEQAIVDATRFKRAKVKSHWVKFISLL